MLYLTDADVAKVLSPEMAAEAIDRAFRSLADGSSAVQARVRTVTPAGKLSTVGGVMMAEGVAGAKVYPTTKEGRFGFVVLLFALSTGNLLAVMKGTALTEIRTAATSVVAARYLAPPEPKVLVIFGSGRQAAAHARAFTLEFDLAEIRLVNRRDAGEFKNWIEGVTGVPAHQVETPREALDGADLVVTATRSGQALFDGRHLPARCHITAVGATTPDGRELDAESIGRAAPIVVESIGQARIEAGDLLLAEREGSPVWGRVVELAQLVAGQSLGRSGPDQITLYESLGIGLEDVAAAAAAYREATARSVGMLLEPGDEPWAG